MTAPYIPQQQTQDEDEFQRWKASRQQAAPSTPDDAEFQAWKSENVETPKGMLRGALATAYQMGTLGLGNKLTAATRAVLPQSLGGTKGFDYQGALKEERKTIGDFQQKHPMLAATSGAVGSVPIMLASGGTAVGPMTVGQSARIGAAYGGMAGAGEPDNPDAKELATSTAGGAALGAGLGVAAHGAVKAPGAFLDYVGIRPTERSTGMLPRLARNMGVQTVEERTPNIILNRLARSNMTPSDVALASADATQMGKPTTLMEIGGRPVARLARGTQGHPGKGAEQIQEFLEGRRRGAPVRVAGDVEAGLGQSRRDAFDLTTEIAARRQAEAKPQYDAAMKAPSIPATTKVAGTNLTLADLLKRPSAQKAIGYEGQLAQEEGRAAFPSLDAAAEPEIMAQMPPEAKAKFAALAKDQGVELSPSVKMEQLHNLKLRLDEMLGYAKNNGKLPDGTPATKKMLRAIQETKNQLLETMDAHSPEYAKGRQIWAGESELQEALTFGEDFLNGKRPIGELKHELGQFSAAGQEHARIGVVNAVRDKIDAAMDGADVVRRIFGNEAQRQRLRAAFPDDASFTQFRKQMEMEGKMAKNENYVLGNSQTAEKIADAADITGSTVSPSFFSLGGVRNAVMREVFRRHLSTLAQQQVDALAPYLTASTPAERAAIIAKLEGASRNQGQTLSRSTAVRRAIGQAAGRTSADLTNPR